MGRPLTEEERAMIEKTVQFLGPDQDDNYKLAILKIGGDDTTALKSVADRFKPGPGEDYDYAGFIKELLDLPGHNIMISVPKDRTKLMVMDNWLRFGRTGLPGWRVYGRLVVMAVARCGEKQVQKCKRCEENGSRPFEGCLTVPGRKKLGCAACLKLYFANGKDKKYDCSFETSE